MNRINGGIKPGAINVVLSSARTRGVSLEEVGHCSNILESREERTVDLSAFSSIMGFRSYRLFDMVDESLMVSE